MKTLICIILLLMATPTSSAETNPAETLKVVITGAERRTGIIMVAIESEAQAFERSDFEKPKFKSRAIIAASKNRTVEFEVIPGIYAIKVFHDENTNGKLDKNFFGVPQERYGFSNGARPNFGPASFEDAKFHFYDSSKPINIELK